MKKIGLYQNVKFIFFKGDYKSEDNQEWEKIFADHMFYE